MNYAYLDTYGILHVVETNDVSETTVATDVECSTGFPVYDGKLVYIYSLEEMYIGGNRNSYKAGKAKKANIVNYPALEHLYIECMNA